MLRIGVVPYINALPLYRYLPYSVVYGTPTELDRKMALGELDIALLPIFSFFKNPEYRPLYEAGAIQSFGPVESVSLFYQENLQRPVDIKSIKYTEESVTSVSLFKVIYSLFWKGNLSALETRNPQPNALLHIGDKALFFSEPGFKTVDLGEEWTKQTDLPFVYACWVSRENISRDVVEQLITARKEGLAKREEIVQQLHDLPLDRMRHYLTKSIQYEITLKSLEGIKKFQDTCFEVGLLKEKRKLLGL